MAPFLPLPPPWYNSALRNLSRAESCFALGRLSHMIIGGIWESGLIW